MNRFSLLFAVSIAAATFSAVNESAGQIADFTVYAGAPPRSIDVTTAFSDPGVTDVVRMETIAGNIDIELFGHDKPITVANFLNYLNQGRYFKEDPTNHQTASTFIHRSIPGFIIQ